MCSSVIALFSIPSALRYANIGHTGHVDATICIKVSYFTRPGSGSLFGAGTGVIFLARYGFRVKITFLGCC